jgi:7-carboxy-7-deazaguanine synthase
MALRLLEHYTSTQGEGPNVGKLTQFVRFAGCNLKCPGWPCDTPFSIEPQLYRNEMQLVTARALAAKVFAELEATGAENVCLTGGEPTLQPQGELYIFLSDLIQRGLTSFELFTNGTRPFDPAFADLVQIVMDWKLGGSGEDPFNEGRIENLKFLEVGDSIKFVIATQTDLSQAHTLWQQYIRDVLPIETFVGAAWGKMAPSHIVEYIKDNQLPWRLNVQVHNYIYGAHVRGT